MSERLAFSFLKNEKRNEKSCVAVVMADAISCKTHTHADVWSFVY
jgi:hypothetical protein